MALEKFGDIPAHCVLAVGDTAYDIEAAGKIGVGSIGLLSDGGNLQELQQAGALAIYQDPADLLQHYEVTPLR